MRRRRNRTHEDAPSLSHRLGRAPAIVIGVMVVLVLLDWVVGLVLSSIPEPGAKAITAYSDQDLARLYQSDDVARIRTVLAETAALPVARYEPLVEYRMAPFKGRLVTVGADGVRGSAAPQDMAADGGKVFVFGGSTTFGLGLADDETVPARLQQGLRAQGREVQVFNFGAVSWYSTQERLAFERLLTAGTRPDLAVFIDGLADFQWCLVPDQTAWSPRLAQASGLVKFAPPLGEILARSNLLKLWRRATQDGQVEAPSRSAPCRSEAELDQAIRRLDINRRLIAGMADKMGFKVLFVQQPVPTFAYDNAKRAVAVSASDMRDYVTSGRAYPRMAELRAAGQIFEDGLLWLADLDAGDANAYVDPVHYSPAYAGLIADRLTRHILDASLLP